jgi:hypothetical protein
MGGRGRATHRRGLSARLVTGPTLVRAGGIGVSMVTVAAILIFGGTTPPQNPQTPEVPIASDVQPPTVRSDPSPPTPQADAADPASSAKTVTPVAREDSPASSKVKTKPTKEKPAAMRVWSAVGSYEQGELVRYQGSTYRAVKDYTGVGDPNWIYADSLWVRL